MIVVPGELALALAFLVGAFAGARLERLCTPNEPSAGTEGAAS